VHTDSGPKLRVLGIFPAGQESVEKPTTETEKYQIEKE
jgi:hypothetical protein